MPILKVKNKETGEWEQVGVSFGDSLEPLKAHEQDLQAHPDIRAELANKAPLDATGKVPQAYLPEISSVKVFKTTIGTAWTDNEDTGAKTQTVAISGITAAHTAKVDHYFAGEHTSEGYAAYVEEENQYLTCITNGFAETVEGGLKFTIFGDANTVAIPIIVEVV